MIDPITAVATATTAFNGIKKMVEAGQNIESTFGQIGKWYGAVADGGSGPSHRDSSGQTPRGDAIPNPDGRAGTPSRPRRHRGSVLDRTGATSRWTGSTRPV